MSRAEFEDCVADALDAIPEQFADQIKNVVVLVEDDPPPATPRLLGVYEGVPITERDHWYGVGNLPDRILIFRNPTLTICQSRDEVIEEVYTTVMHEVAHYFGIDDERLDDLGWA